MQPGRRTRKNKKRALESDKRFSCDELVIDEVVRTYWDELITQRGEIAIGLAHRLPEAKTARNEGKRSRRGNGLRNCYIEENNNYSELLRLQMLVHGLLAMHI